MLPQDLRLPSIDIAPLMRHGKRVHEGGIDLIFRKTIKGKHFAFIVSTKVDKHATGRNRIKRLLREATAAHIPHIEDGFDGILIVKGKTSDEYEKMKELLYRLFNAAGVFHI